ncbi:sugar fermentation stimulation protein [Loktanella sp. 3ANDIMAR09]|uniref:DNA/RNA nuclease SfsA n=1 Tax=Loktanella sp. 3ANDIMAR09 TaxID=1225657 RepID=UPI0006FDEE1B|nr:DNA/RNA nuclease SfsA [Loktanella sp. 3ANDIMAR09]KQI67959.1 sugar fermentation stimulation protein [Loktanella sp. 3ANDIMAR09]
MNFARPLIPATLIRRYKRFLADVTLDDGTEVTAHVANPGKMTGLAEPGMQVWLETNDDPKRKLKYAWRLVDDGGALVCVDTAQANRVVGEGLRAGRVPGLTGYTDIRSEVKYAANSRVDFLLTGDGPALWLEVKSATVCRTPGLAEFPDTATARGARHMADLADRVAAGDRAAVFFLVNRTDCDAFDVARDIDPVYGAAFDAAVAAGVEVIVMDATMDRDGIALGRVLPLGRGGMQG